MTLFKRRLKLLFDSRTVSFPNMRHLIFIYGSLRRGCENEIARTFPGASFVSQASVNGALYDLGDYPALVLDDAGEKVMGEIYEIDEALLTELDEFELASDYHRSPVTASAGSDQRQCWVYVPSKETCAGKSLIPSGDWIAFAKGRKK